MRILSVTRLFGVFLCGIIVGALVFNSLSVRAQDRAAVFVDEVPDIGRTVVTGSQVVGFSCVRETPPPPVDKWAGADTTCYVASTR